MPQNAVPKSITLGSWFEPVIIRFAAQTLYWLLSSLSSSLDGYLMFRDIKDIATEL